MRQSFFTQCKSMNELFEENVMFPTGFVLSRLVWAYEETQENLAICQVVYNMRVFHVPLGLAKWEHTIVKRKS